MEALPAPTAEGLLAKTPLAHLFIYVMERRMTGSLELRRADGDSGALVFVDGIPQKARTPDGTATLGAVLVQHAVISQEQANESIDRRFQTGMLQGQVLVGMGAITPDILLGGLAAQLEAKIQVLFEFPFDTHFAFYEGHDTLASYGGAELVQVDPLKVLWAGVRQNPSWEHVNATVSRVQHMGMRFNAHAAPERCNFGPGEREAVELLRQRPVRLDDLTATRVMNPTHAQLFVYFFVITKQLELVEAPSPSSRPERMSVAAPPAPPPPQSAGAQVARVQLQARQVARGPAIIEEHRPIRPDSRMSPMPQAYPIPEEMRSPPAAMPLHVEGDYSAPMAMAVPPPAPSAPPPSSPAGPSSSRIPAVGSASQSRMPAAGPASTRSPSVSPPSSRFPAAGPDGQPVRTGAEDGLRSKILTKADQVDSQDHYEVLGVAKSAAKEDIQKAFFALAKVWHPDKLPNALADVRDACSKVFARLSEAHSVLVDPARRGEYDKAVREGIGSQEEQLKVQEVLEASNNFQKALIFLKRNDNAQGEELARKALAADPTQADYLALVTWLDSQKPVNQNRDKTIVLIGKLDDAIKMNANCERAHYYRGMLHKRVDNMKQAIKDLKRAVELNPHNLDAAREIRLHTMRTSEAKSAKADSIGGLFGKLFKK